MSEPKDFITSDGVWVDEDGSVITLVFCDSIPEKSRICPMCGTRR